MKKTHHISAFTLIEIMVAVAIFSVVMVVALGALLSLSVADRRAEAIKTATDNLNFAVDSMSRTIRTGTNYNCNTPAGLDCASPGGNTLYFNPAGGGLMAYKLENMTTDPSNAATICNQSGTVGCIARETSNDGGITWTPWAAITAPEVVITNPNNILFYLRGSQIGAADNMQPILTILLSGYVQVTGLQTSAFNLQTTVTQRLYDQ
jgi:prepilin-type N-terminal cleavage/methylation domain-containing protein